MKPVAFFVPIFGCDWRHLVVKEKAPEEIQMSLYLYIGTEVGDLKGSQRQKCFTPISGLVVRPLA